FVQPGGSDGFLEWGSVEVGADAARAAAPSGVTEAPFALDLELPVAGAVVLRLPDDSGPHDNAVHFVVRPKPRALKILQVGAVSEPLTRALKAAAEVELYAADSVPADAAAFDLIVANGIGLARETTKLLNALADEIEGKPGRKSMIADSRNPVVGTRLVREWAGAEHTTIVLRDGFEFEGRKYKSLSAIARDITGTRWNGYRF